MSTTMIRILVNGSNLEHASREEDGTEVWNVILHASLERVGLIGQVKFDQTTGEYHARMFEGGKWSMGPYDDRAYVLSVMDRTFRETPAYRRIEAIYQEHARGLIVTTERDFAASQVLALHHYELADEELAPMP